MLAGKYAFLAGFMLISAAAWQPALAQSSDSRSSPPANDKTAAPGVNESAKPQQRTLRVATWGGAYGAAQKTAIIEPAEAKLGIRIERLPMARSEEADVREIGQADLIKACASGRLAKLGDIALSGDQQGNPARSDFVDGSLSPCGVASFAWSALMLVDRAKFDERPPRSIADAFDTKRFPGKRALIRRAEHLFEFLAIAEGAAPDEIYTALGDRQKLDAAVKRLEAMLPDIIWVETPTSAIAQIDNGSAVAAMGFSGRAFRKTIAGSVRALWQGHIYEYSSWAIPAGTRNRELAQAFIKLATAPEVLTAQARLWPYGPMRKSSAGQVGRHDVLNVELAGYMPTSDINLGRGTRFDAAFWNQNSERLNDRLAALLNGFPGGIRVPPPVRRPAPPAPEPQQDAGTTGSGPAN